MWDVCSRKIQFYLVWYLIRTVDTHKLHTYIHMYVRTYIFNSCFFLISKYKDGKREGKWGRGGGGVGEKLALETHA